MAPRPQWKGYLKLSLVSCPIGLYPAISAAERVSFRQVNTQTGNRLRQQMVDAVTGEVVRSHDKGRGYEVSHQQFLLVRDEDLEAAQQEARKKPFNTAPTTTAGKAPEQPPSRGAPSRNTEAPRLAAREEVRTPAGSYEQPTEIAPLPPPVRVENNRTIEIERFVPLAQIDPRYHDTPYYIAPRDEVGQEAFAVIRDAMGDKEMVGMGHVVLAKRERPIIIRPLGKGLLGLTLRYSHEVRNEAEYFAGIPDLELPEEMIQVAEHILDLKTADFDPALLEDRYRTVLVSMLRKKQAELPQEARAVAPSRQNVINLMDALKRSLETERPPAPAKPTRRGKSPGVKPTRRPPRSRDAG
jgi:non-homologous end joining protein Ku